MNKLVIGTADKTALLLQTAGPFLLVDDGPVADAFIARFPKARVFNPTEDSFNPMKGMDYKRARDFATILYTASPQGENTLTVRNGKRALTKILLANTTRLDKLRYSSSDADQEVKEMVDDVLLSPILKRVLCNPTDFSFKGSVIARLDRAELGDFDAFILGTLLMGQHKGQIIVPDFGFYGRPLHVSLMRQNRLTCSVSYLAELSPALRQAVLLIPNKHGSGCTFEDAQTLAAYEGLAPHHNNYNDFIEEVMLRPEQS